MVKWSHYGAILWCTSYPGNTLLATILRKIGEDILLLNQSPSVSNRDVQNSNPPSPVTTIELRERERLVGPINVWGPSMDMSKNQKKIRVSNKRSWHKLIS